MKKTFLSLSKLAMSTFSCLLAMSIASCGDDDGDNQNEPPKKPEATTATVQPAAYMATNTLKYFDLYIVNSKGDSTKITLANTEVVTKAEFGHLKKDYELIFDTYKKKNNFEMRTYKHSEETLKSFPANVTYKIVGKPNGTIPDTSEKIGLSIFPDMKFSNNTNTWYKIGVSTTISTSAPISGSRWEEYAASPYSKIEHEIKLTFETADKVSGYAH